MLSPLQLRIAATVNQLDEAEDFVLAGGAALVARGDVDRITRDLDYFARSADQVPRLQAALERALSAAGLTVTTVRAERGFARLAFSRIRAGQPSGRADRPASGSSRRPCAGRSRPGR
jgi:hypothetical protein